MSLEQDVSRETMRAQGGEFNEMHSAVSKSPKMMLTTQNMGSQGPTQSRSLIFLSKHMPGCLSSSFGEILMAFFQTRENTTKHVLIGSLLELYLETENNISLLYFFFTFIFLVPICSGRFLLLSSVITDTQNWFAAKDTIFQPIFTSN